MPRQKSLAPHVPFTADGYFAQAVEAYEEGCFGEACSLFGIAGSKGDTRGWLRAGQLTAHGLHHSNPEPDSGWPQNDYPDVELAQHLYMRAVEAGDPSGMVALGMTYFYSAPVLARRWFKKAERLGAHDATAALHKLDEHKASKEAIVRQFREARRRERQARKDAAAQRRMQKTGTLPPGLLLGREALARESQPMGFHAPQETPPPSPAILRYTGDAHALTFAPTGAGKGVSCVIPNCLAHTGALIVLDMKGDIYHATVERRRQMGQKVYRLNLTDNGETDSLNPLDLARLTGSETAAIARSLASELVERTGGERDRFWSDWSETILTGGIAWLMDDVEPENRNLAHLFDFLTVEISDIRLLLR